MMQIQQQLFDYFIIAVLLILYLSNIIPTVNRQEKSQSFMIIQFECKNSYTNTLAHASTAIKPDKIQSFNNSLSPSIQVRKGNIIRISMQKQSKFNKKVANTENKKCFNKTYTEGYNRDKSKLIDIDIDKNIAAKSYSFKPVFQPRRTYGNLKYFLEVIQKKVRARSIQNTFEQSNYQLDSKKCQTKGFKGGKLSDYSQFYGRLNVNSKERKRLYYLYSQEEQNKKSKSLDTKTQKISEQNQQNQQLKQKLTFRYLNSSSKKQQKNITQIQQKKQLHNNNCHIAQTQPTSQSVLSKFQSFNKKQDHKNKKYLIEAFTNKNIKQQFDKNSKPEKQNQFRNKISFYRSKFKQFKQNNIFKAQPHNYADFYQKSKLK